MILLVFYFRSLFCIFSNKTAFLHNREFDCVSIISSAEPPFYHLLPGDWKRNGNEEVAKAEDYGNSYA